MDTLNAALEYARLGFRVLPLKPGTKVPDLRHWPEEASTDPAAIERHWTLSRRRAGKNEPNVGICTGGGLAVVDIDTHHGGEIPAWLDTRTAAVRTASGGLHYYYSVSSDVPNSVGRLAPGVDVRGERGQVAAPPSVITVHPDRVVASDRQGDVLGHYAWVSDLPIARIEPSLLIPEDLKRSFAGVSRGFEYRDEVPVGERNNYLASLAGYLYACGESRADVLQELRQEVDRLGFLPRDGEVEQIARSIGRYH